VETGPSLLGIDASATGRRWALRAADDRMVRAIQQVTGESELLARVLAARGVDAGGAAAFLNPSLKTAMPDPSQLMDMDGAAARVADAVMAGEIIAIFGDYDVDGATSTAVLTRFFRAAGIDPLIHIPDRQLEGYGPNLPALQKLAAAGAKLVITVDCGTTAVAPLEGAAALGLQTIIVDHHQAGSEMPPAFALVNPNRPGDISGQGALAAVGVAFLLAVAVNRALRQRGFWSDARPEPDLMRLLDLVALGTVADVVPLTGLNRVLVNRGLAMMARRANAGLVALADVARMDGPPGAYHLGFLLGPRVNAGGRVGRPDLGARLLMCDDAIEAQAMAAELDRYNEERRAIEAMVLADAEAMAAGEIAPLALLAKEGWHPGVIGIVASRIKDKLDRPAFILAIDGDIAKGSGRSVPGVDLGAAVGAAATEGLLINGGGHKMAAGLTVRTALIPELREFLAARIGPLARGPRGVTVDGLVSVDGAVPGTIRALEKAGPFGQGNPEPRFAVPDARVIRADVVGERHVRLILAGREGRLTGIAFRAMDGALGPFLLSQRGKSVHLAGLLRIDRWKGEERVQIQIDDAAPAGREGQTP